MNSLKYINALTGKEIKEKTDKSCHFFLNLNGEERIQEEDGIVYVYPQEKVSMMGQNDPIPIEEPLPQNISTMFEIGSNENQNVHHILETKKKENAFIKKTLERCEKRVLLCDQLRTEYYHQCRALEALNRHIGRDLINSTDQFLKSAQSKYNEFVELKSRLTKSGELIHTEMIANDIIPSLLSTEGKKKKEEQTIRSMVDLIPIAFGEQNDASPKDILIKHEKRIKNFDELVKGKMDVWKSFFLNRSKHMGELNRKNDFQQLLMNHDDGGNENKNDESPGEETFNMFRRALYNSVELIRDLYNDHSAKLIQVEEEEQSLTKMKLQSSGGSTITPSSFETFPILRELMSDSFTEKLRDLDKSILLDVRKSLYAKQSYDQTLMSFFKPMIEIRFNLKEILSGKEKFPKVCDRMIQNSVRNLIFFQQLPGVYDSCCNEIIRRHQVIDRIKSKVKKFQDDLNDFCSDENKNRHTFIDTQENQLGGQQQQRKKEEKVSLKLEIPRLLIRGIYEEMKVPRSFLNQLTNEMDSTLPAEEEIHVVKMEMNSASRGWDFLDENEYYTIKRNDEPQRKTGRGKEEEKFLREEELGQTNVFLKMSERNERLKQEAEPLFEELLDEHQQHQRSLQQGKSGGSSQEDERIRKMKETIVEKEKDEVGKLEEKIEELEKKVEELVGVVKNKEELLSNLKNDKNAEISTLKHNHSLKLEDLTQNFHKLKAEFSQAKIEYERNTNKFKEQVKQLQERNETLQKHINEKNFSSVQQSSIEKDLRNDVLKQKKEVELLKTRLTKKNDEIKQKEREVQELRRSAKQRHHSFEQAQKKWGTEKKKLEDSLSSTQKLLEEVLNGKQKKEKDAAKEKEWKELLEKEKAHSIDLEAVNRKLVKEIEQMKKQHQITLEGKQKMSSVVEQQLKMIQDYRREIDVLKNKVLVSHHKKEEEGEESEKKKEGIEDMKLLPLLLQKYGKKIKQLDQLQLSADRWELLTLMMRFDGNLENIMNYIFHEKKDTGSDMEELVKRSVVVENFGLNDRMFFEKVREGVWEGFSIYEEKEKGKRLMYLSEECVREIKRLKPNARQAIGKVVQFRKIQDLRRENPLKLNKTHILCMVTIDWVI